MSTLLEVKNLKVHFPVKAGMFGRVRETVKAVDDVSFSIAPGETLCPCRPWPLRKFLSLLPSAA